MHSSSKMTSALGAAVVVAVTALTIDVRSASAAGFSGSGQEAVVENSWSYLILKPFWLPPNPCSVSRCTR